MLAFSPVVTTCIAHYGWRDALRILSAGILGVGLVSSLFLTNSPAEDYTAAPGECPGETVVPMEKQSGDCTEGTDSGEHGIKVDEVDSKDVAGGTNTDRLRILVFLKSVEVCLWFIGNVLAVTGWTFFNINFVSM